MGHEAPGRPDLTHKPPLLGLKQWLWFCTAYARHTGAEYYLGEKTTHNLAEVGHPVATAQWAAWLRWVAVYKLTGDGRGSFITEEG